MPPEITMGTPDNQERRVPGNEVAVPGGRVLAPRDGSETLRDKFDTIAVRRPVIGKPWEVPADDAHAIDHTRKNLPDSSGITGKLTDASMDHKHVDSLGTQRANVDLVAAFALEAVVDDPNNTAIIFDLSLTGDADRVKKAAEGRGIVVEEQGISPRMFLNGLRPDQWKEIVEKSLPGAENTNPLGSITRKVTGVLADHYGRPATLDEVDWAIRYLAENNETMGFSDDPAQEAVKSPLARSYPKAQRERYADSFQSLADLFTTWNDSEPRATHAEAGQTVVNSSAPAVPNEAGIIEAELVDDKTGEVARDQIYGRELPKEPAQVVIFSLPPGEIGSQTELRGLLAGRLPQVIAHTLPEGTPAYLGVIDGHDLPPQVLPAIVDLSAANQVGLTHITYDPAKTSEETAQFIHTKGSLTVSRSTGSGARLAAEIAGTTHGEKLTGKNIDSSTSAGGSSGSSRTLGDSGEGSALQLLKPLKQGSGWNRSESRSSDRNWSGSSSRGESFTVGEQNVVEPSRIRELPLGDIIGIVPNARGIDTKTLNLAVEANMGPGVPLDAQLRQALPGVNVKDAPPAVTQRQERPRIRGFRAANRESIAKKTDDADRALATAAARETVAAIGASFSDVVTAGEIRLADNPTPAQKELYRFLAASTPAQREATLQVLAEQSRVPKAVADKTIARDRISQRVYPTYLSDLKRYEKMRELGSDSNKELPSGNED